MKHSQVAANCIELHAVELGEGPAVLFCHGFPSTWHVWRRQMEAVAAAGYRAVAVDMRGYGRSSAPPDAAHYTQFHTVGDLVGLLDALELPAATIVGHDFGASVAWNAAMMRPDRFRAVFALSVPFPHRGTVSVLDKLRAAGMHDFYMFPLMRPEADGELADAGRTIRGALYWSSATPAPGDRWSPFDPTLGLGRAVPAMPAWVEPSFLDETVAEFARTGFHGGLNYYRALQLGFDLAGAYKNAGVAVPSFFLTGADDGLNALAPVTTEALRRNCTDLRGRVVLEGAGHWPQLEAVAATNAALLGFLAQTR